MPELETIDSRGRKATKRGNWRGDVAEDGATISVDMVMMDDAKQAAEAAIARDAALAAMGATDAEAAYQRSKSRTQEAWRGEPEKPKSETTDAPRSPEQARQKAIIDSVNAWRRG